ncbi:MAG TPA: hypothetical protein VMR75_02865 [Candidatus Saccharimonadales bacterium]|nr:hypothetical protein [Candidatus Saccharimonadales bacterium]
MWRSERTKWRVIDSCIVIAGVVLVVLIIVTASARSASLTTGPVRITGGTPSYATTSVATPTPSTKPTTKQYVGMSSEATIAMSVAILIVVVGFLAFMVHASPSAVSPRQKS